jgi:predicted Zn-dependent peptidase
MRKVFFRHLFVVILCLLFLVPAAAQLQTARDGNYEYQYVQGDPLNARIYKLDNGLTVFLTVYKNEPRVQTYIAVKAGSKNDPADATGLAHYLEHMLFKGTDKFGTTDYAKEKVLTDKIISLYEEHRKTKDADKRKQIYAEIDKVSNEASKYILANEYDKMISSIGGKGTNAYTSVEQTVYVNDIPSNQIETWLTIEAERFRKPVMRLFHTELETVYEEKNMSLDDDGDKVWETIMAQLFPHHQYGQQTTIGTIEHLKNPSIQKVIDYYNMNYVPNNMAIALSGDFDPSEVIRLIDEKFGYMQPKPVPQFIPAVEKPITSPIKKEVWGQEAENLYIGYRFNGVNTNDDEMLRLFNWILSNGSVGLIDLNLNQEQKVLGAGAFPVIFKDFTAFMLYGNPRQGQTLEQVETLLLNEIEKLKKGDFPDWLIEASINNIKLDRIRSFESNRSRAHSFVTAFVQDIPWDEYLSFTDRLSSITKDDVVRFANEHFKNNYVVVYKRQGEDKNVQKVEKPKITPVAINRDEQTQFHKEIISRNAQPVEPVFLDYKTDIQQIQAKNNIPILYKQNTENELFQLYYVLDMGTDNDKALDLAVNYLNYLGTSKYSPTEIKQEFFKLGSSFGVSGGRDQTYLSIEGLNSNLEETLRLFEEFINDLQPNKPALDNLVKDVLKARQDAKTNQETILWDALYDYAKFSENSPFKHIMSEQELLSVTPDELINKIKELNTYQHKVLYYGPSDINAVRDVVNKLHTVPEQLKPVTPPVVFTEQPTDNNKIYFVNYPEMVQAEIVIFSKFGQYNKDIVPILSMYNEYFGSGMSGIIFQELREAKALAYSTYASFTTPKKKDLSHYVIGYIGTQSDKLPEAMDGLVNIINNMPQADITFSAAKNNLIQNMQTSRVTKSGVLFNYLAAQKMGLDYDIRRDIYQGAQSFTMQDVVKFFETNVKGRNYNILVLGDKIKLDMSYLQKYGNVEEVTLEKIFGY